MDHQVAALDGPGKVLGHPQALDDLGPDGLVEEGEPARALGLGPPHGQVGVPEDVGGGLARTVRVDHDDAGRDGLAAQLGVRAVDPGPDLLEPLHGLVPGADAGDSDGERVAAEAGDDVVGPDQPSQPLGEPDQHLVAGLHAVALVDRPEVVQVEARHDRPLAGLGAGVDGGAERVEERLAVGQTGEQVVGGGLLQLPLCVAELGDVLLDDHEVLDLVGGREQRGDGLDDPVQLAVPASASDLAGPRAVVADGRPHLTRLRAPAEGVVERLGDLADGVGERTAGGGRVRLVHPGDAAA